MFEFVTHRYGSDELTVVSFVGVEQLSKPFRFDVLIAGRDLDVGAVADELLTQPAHLRIVRDDVSARAVYGVVQSVTAQATSGGADGVHTYRLRLVPRMQLLARSQGSRIFQNQTVRAIVSHVLDEWNVRHRWSLLRPGERREYCVQYLESDYQFVTRLLAEEGIFFWFEHSEEDEREVVVFGDTPHAIGPIEGDPRLHLRHDSGMRGDHEDVHSFEVTDRVRPEQTLLREFDFLRPLLDLRAASSGDPFLGAPPLNPLGALGSLGSLDASIPGVPGLPDGGPPSPPSVPEMSGMAVAIPGAPEMPDVEGLVGDAIAGLMPRRPYRGGTRRIYDHIGEIDQLGVDQAMAARHLEQHRNDARIGGGESRCTRLTPGRSFTLVGSPLAAHDSAYTLIRVKHVGHHPEHSHHQGEGAPRDVYRNSFECVPADVTPRPRRRKRRLQQVVETATVVGPPGQEIHTDPHGRIRVQFHWDLEGVKNQRSSCWIRVMQAWSGTAWGFQFIPRVGMEVLVTFVGGDVDRPMVLGCVPNAENPMPFRLPREKTKSGIRTRSSRHSNGYNELSFEDRRGRERVYVRAEKDLQEEVVNDHSTSVGSDQTLRVGHNQTVVVSGTRFDAIAENRIATVGGDQTEHVGGAEKVTVDGSATRRVGNDSTLVVEGDRDCHVRGGAVEHVEERRYTRVRGFHETFVGEKDNPAGASMAVWGTYRIACTDIVIDGKNGVTLRCGDTELSVTEDTITMTAAKLRFVGTEEVVIESGGSRVKLDGDAELLGSSTNVHSTGASLELSDTAVLRGSQVALAGGGGDQASSDDDTPAPGTERLRLILSDEEGEPHAGNRYDMVVAGRHYKGSTGGDGSLQHDIPEDAVSATVRLWITDSEIVDYQIELDRDLEPASTVRGALSRLRSLGYFSGDVTDELTDEAREAIRYFQADREITVNGDLDGSTQGELEDRAGG